MFERLACMPRFVIRLLLLRVWHSLICRMGQSSQLATTGGVGICVAAALSKLLTVPWEIIPGKVGMLNGEDINPASASFTFKIAVCRSLFCSSP